MEPARIHRCGLLVEKNVRGVCMAPPLWELRTRGRGGPQAK
jgi:hypothetical protein